MIFFENVFRVINVVIIQLFDVNKTKELEGTQIALHIMLKKSHTVHHSLSKSWD